jgi:REP element-mobilizing transposase RayT
MTRGLRINIAGGVYHVTVRGNDRQRIFNDNADFDRFLLLFGTVVADHEWLCLAYCLMTNHAHFLIETPLPNLSSGMCRVNGWYSRSFNKRHGRADHLLRQRFKDRLIERDEHLRWGAAYLALNPVDAAMCGQPEDWRWSSHAATLGQCAGPSWLAVDRLLEYFGALGGSPLARYTEMVETVQRYHQPSRVPGTLEG